MKKTLYFFLIIFLALFISSVNAQNTAPEEYTIKKGDTLWDISNSKLEDWFLWPKLWKVNPQIKNPDLIYPGDKIIIPTLEELMRMFPEEVPLEEVVEEKPVEVPKEKPKQYIVDKKRFISSGWISDKFLTIGEITDAPESRTIFGFGRNDLVYIRVSGNVVIGDKFFALRDIKEVKHPETREPIGHQIRITGILEVIGMDGKNKDVPKAKISTAFEDVVIGDGLMPYVEVDPPLVPDIIRTPNIDGYIVESHMNSSMIGRGDIVYLDKGQNDGLQVGDIFSTLFDKPIERSIGTIQVISLQPTTSAAVILKSEQEITVGDRWGKK